LKSICEEKIFKNLFEKRLNPLRNFLCYKSGNANLSEDLAQEAFYVYGRIATV